MKKFSFCIGNPAYQDTSLGENATFMPPVYDKFLDSAFEIADKVEMIHPARFLFNAGSTPKAWNEKMLNDEHFKVLHYEENAAAIFPNTDIKGGIAITYRDRTHRFGAIHVFTKYPELNTILQKAMPSTEEDSLMSVIYIQNRLNLKRLYETYPDSKAAIGSDGKDSRFEKNIFAKLNYVFTEQAIPDSIRTVGIFNNKRTWRYIPRKYVEAEHANLKKYKVVIPVANGKGEFGETFSTPELLAPDEAYTRSFIGIGACSTQSEAKAVLSYVKTKFARTMLSILKVTQMANPDVWRYVPKQDFTSHSDINWNTSVANIDKQLYKKYGLTTEEIQFIESNVKEMV